jgi:hypothetical protein
MMLISSNQNSRKSMDDIVQTIFFPMVELDEIIYNYIFYMNQKCLMFHD